MGIREMICVIISTDVPMEDADRVISISTQKARTYKYSSINILFLSNKSPEVFKYRDVFTKYIDLGLRVYTESNIKVLRNIIKENCTTIYFSINDKKALQFSQQINDVFIYKV